MDDSTYSNIKNTQNRMRSIRSRYEKRGSQKNKSVLTGRQKVAIFLVALGSQVSARIFEHLSEEEVEAVTLEIARIDNIDSNVRESVLKEFHNLFLGQKSITKGGMQYARELLERVFGAEKSIEMINRLTAHVHLRPFDVINNADPAHILNLIHQEHPQTIALILAHIGPQKASFILSSLSNEVRSDVSKRIATMDHTSPEVIREVERVLEKKLSTLSSEDYTASGGIESIVDILNLVDRSTEKSIIESLEEEDPELAEEIKRRMFVFEDIVMLHDQAIQKVLHEVDPAELARALKIVDSDVQEKIFKNMSKRAATLLKEDMEYIGAIRLHDVEVAQQTVVGIVRRLEEAGDIVIVRADEDDLIV